MVLKVNKETTLICGEIESITPLWWDLLITCSAGLLWFALFHLWLVQKTFTTFSANQLKLIATWLIAFSHVSGRLPVFSSIFINSWWCFLCYIQLLWLPWVWFYNTQSKGTWININYCFIYIFVCTWRKDLTP